MASRMLRSGSSSRLSVENATPLAGQRNARVLPFRLLPLPFLLLGQVCKALYFSRFPFLTGPDVLFVNLRRLASL